MLRAISTSPRTRGICPPTRRVSIRMWTWPWRGCSDTDIRRSRRRSPYVDDPNGLFNTVLFVILLALAAGLIWWLPGTGW